MKNVNEERRDLENRMRKVNKHLIRITEKEKIKNGGDGLQD